jgi:CRP/FNR family transcriptional regulator, cyclic AMP receptor protein
MRETLLTLETIKEIPFFKSLQAEELDVLLHASSLMQVAKHRKVYNYGDTSQYVYVVLKGSIKLATQTEGNKILVKYIIYKNELFGENVFSSFTERMEFAEALTDSSVLKIDVAAFRKLVGTNGELMATLAAIIIGRIKDLEERMQSFIFLKAKERITGFIKKTASSHGIMIGINETLINHGLSHKEIAYLTDTSRQTVARILNELKEANVIYFSDRKPNKILIRELAAL